MTARWLVFGAIIALILLGAILGGGWFPLALSVAALLWLVAYALAFTRLRVVAAPWLLVIKGNSPMLYTRWLNDRTVESFRALHEREGMPPFDIVLGARRSFKFEIGKFMLYGRWLTAAGDTKQRR